jgi:hypothetical protein
MSDLYDADVLEWSEYQARLLRQHATGKPGNETPDWANIIEEVESVGRSQLSAVRSLLTRALEHDLKCKKWPQCRDVPHWRIEARRFRIDAAEAFTLSMRPRIDMDGLYRKALSLLPETTDGQPPLAVDPACPVTLEHLLQGGC